MQCEAEKGNNLLLRGAQTANVITAMQMTAACLAPLGSDLQFFLFSTLSIPATVAYGMNCRVSGKAEDGHVALERHAKSTEKHQDTFGYVGGIIGGISSGVAMACAHPTGDPVIDTVVTISAAAAGGLSCGAVSHGLGNVVGGTVEAFSDMAKACKAVKIPSVGGFLKTMFSSSAKEIVAGPKTLLEDSVSALTNVEKPNPVAA